MFIEHPSTPFEFKAHEKIWECVSDCEFSFSVQCWHMERKLPLCKPVPSGPQCRLRPLIVPGELHAVHRLNLALLISIVQFRLYFVSGLH